MKRKKSRKSGIYYIQNLINLKIYVGQSIDVKDRLRQHKYALRGGYHINNHLQNAWNKYGEESFLFGVFEYCDESVLDEQERVYIQVCRQADRCYNFESGGTNGYRHSEETRTKMSKAHSKRERVPHSEETKKRISFSLTGKKLSLETRTKMSKSRSGKRNGMYGRHRSEEVKQKLREANLGKRLSEETKDKISKSLQGEQHPNFGKPMTQEQKNKISASLRGQKQSDETKRKRSESLKAYWAKRKQQENL